VGAEKANEAHCLRIEEGETIERIVPCIKEGRPTTAEPKKRGLRQL